MLKIASVSSGPYQNRGALLYGFLRFDANRGIVIVRDGMGNHHKWVAPHTRDFGHYLRRFHKSIRNNGGGGNARFFGRNSVVQTAR